MHHYSWGRPIDSDMSVEAKSVMDLEDEDVFCGPHGNPSDVVEDSPRDFDTFEYLLGKLAGAMGVPMREGGALPQAVTTQLRAKIEELALIEPILIDAEHDYVRIIRLPDHDEAWVTGLAAIDGDELDGYRVRGLLIDNSLAVSPTHRNLGIGSALVAAQLLSEGELTAWGQVPHRFTTGGKAAARRGLKIASKICAAELETGPSCPQPGL
jgi:GNAT superfamily N-acetyltransferase